MASGGSRQAASGPKLSFTTSKAPPYNCLVDRASTSPAVRRS
jgi:hypothetical protein